MKNEFPDAFPKDTAYSWVIWDFVAGFVERVKPGYAFKYSANINDAERYHRLMAFLENHPFITRKDYCEITGCLKNKALNNLNLIADKGYLTTLGQGCHKVYVKAVNKEVTNEIIG